MVIGCLSSSRCLLLFWSSFALVAESLHGGAADGRGIAKNALDKQLASISISAEGVAEVFDGLRQTDLGQKAYRVKPAESDAEAAVEQAHSTWVKGICNGAGLGTWTTEATDAIAATKENCIEACRTNNKCGELAGLQNSMCYSDCGCAMWEEKGTSYGCTLSRHGFLGGEIHAASYYDTEALAKEDFPQVVPATQASGTSSGSCPDDCNACDSTGQCTECGNSRYLSLGACLQACPPGYTEEGSTIVGRICKACRGKVVAGQCEGCGPGLISKEDSDECQNLQDTCTPEQCTPCDVCMNKVEPLFATCVKERDSTATCLDPAVHWCAPVIEQLNSCQGMSLGCYFKLRCQSPCVCSSWKTNNCGGDTGNASAVCPHAPSGLMENGHAMMQRSQVHADTDGKDNVDGSLSGKCM